MPSRGTDWLDRCPGCGSTDCGCLARSRAPRERARAILQVARGMCSDEAPYGELDTQIAKAIDALADAMDAPRGKSMSDVHYKAWLFERVVADGGTIRLSQVAPRQVMGTVTWPDRERLRFYGTTREVLEQIDAAL